MLSGQHDGRAIVIPGAKAVGLAQVLQRIGRVTRDWPGTRLGDSGGLFCINPAGRRPPLFWVFNASNEPQALGLACGPDQPLVAMRSLNQILPAGERSRSGVMDELAAFYAAQLKTSFGGGPCIVGGNCQAAEIAWRLAGSLRREGVPVMRCVSLDAEINLPLPLPVRAIYGSESMFNPRKAVMDAATIGLLRRRTMFWERIFPSFQLIETSGGHGQYFLPENVDALAQRILRPGPLPGAPGSVVPGIVWRQSRTGEGTVLLEAPLPPALLGVPAEELALAPVIPAPGGTAYFGPRVSPGSTSAVIGEGRVRFQLTLPPAALATAWKAILCRRGTGPLVWPIEDQPAVAS